jgi:hypothetical protein
MTHELPIVDVDEYSASIMYPILLFAEQYEQEQIAAVLSQPFLKWFAITMHSREIQPEFGFVRRSHL